MFFPKPDVRRDKFQSAIQIRMDLLELIFRYIKLKIAAKLWTYILSFHQIRKTIFHIWVGYGVYHFLKVIS